VAGGGLPHGWPMRRFGLHLTYENTPHTITFLHSTSPVCNPSRRSVVSYRDAKRPATSLCIHIARSHLVTARFVYPRLVSKLIRIDKTGSTTGLLV